MNTYSGLDLGVKSSAFCIVNEKGKLIAEDEIPTDEKCFEREFGQADMMRVVVEACPLAEWTCLFEYIRSKCEINLKCKENLS